MIAAMPIQRVSLGQHRIAIHDVAATRRLESLWHASVAVPTSPQTAARPDVAAPSGLMQRAGQSVARLMLAVAPDATRIVVAVGPGNNGGDGLVAAAHLHAAGKQVTAVLTHENKALPNDALAALTQAREAGVRLQCDWPSTPCDALVDALLGIGNARRPQGALAEIWRAMHSHPAPMLAVDLPSGLDADRGVARFDAMPGRPASHTLSLLTLKAGVFTGVGRDLCGTLWLDRLGTDDGVDNATAWLGIEASQQQPASRLHASHKGSFGDVAVVGGAPGMRGALVLACTAALAAGSGRVFAVPLDAQRSATATSCSADVHVAIPPEVMVRPATVLRQRTWLAAVVMVVGCGAGEHAHDDLPSILSGATRLVLDADALNAVASDETLQRLLRSRMERGKATVLTPHPLEAARLLGMPGAQIIQADRLRSAQQLADRFSCVVALKGAGTVIAALNVAPVINPTGNGLLATAGTGDVLAGWIGGRWAVRGDLSPGALQDLVAAAVWHHGAAADAVRAAGTPRSMSASALIVAMNR